METTLIRFFSAQWHRVSAHRDSAHRDSAHRFTEHWLTASKLRFLVIFILAFLIRAILIYRNYPAEGWSTIGNGFELGSIAANLAEGRGFSSPFGEGSTPTAWIAPLIPFIWSLVFRVFGVFTDSSLVVIFGLQAVGRSISCVLYAYLLERLMSKISVRTPHLTYLLCLALAVWPENYFITTLPWYYTWQELSFLVVLTALISFHDTPHISRAHLLGLASGSSILINPVPLPWILLGHLYLLSEGVRRGDKAVWRNIAVSALIMLVMALPWSIRNINTVGKGVFLRSNLGVEILQGNYYDGSVVQTRASRHPTLRPEEMNYYRELGEARYSDRAMELAIEYIVSHPMETLRRTLQRVYVFWCTDLLESWPWLPSLSLNHRGGTFFVRRFIRALQYILPLVWLAFMARSGILGKIPYSTLFLAALVIIPLPHYLTISSPVYAHQTHFLLVFLAMLGVNVWVAERLKEEGYQEREEFEGLVANA